MGEPFCHAPQSCGGLFLNDAFQELIHLNLASKSNFCKFVLDGSENTLGLFGVMSEKHSLLI